MLARFAHHIAVDEVHLGFAACFEVGHHGKPAGPESRAVLCECGVDGLRGLRRFVEPDIRVQPEHRVDVQAGDARRVQHLTRQADHQGTRDRQRMQLCCRHAAQQQQRVTDRVKHQLHPAVAY